MKNKRNNKILVFLILMISVGFAYLSANLAINASIGFKESSWDVHFASIEVNENSSDLTKPIIDSKNTSLTFNTTINEPGDFYEFTVDVVNAGTMDAVLDNFIKSPLTSEQEKVIEYTVRSYGEETLKTNTVLHAGYSEKIVIRVEYKYDVESLEHIENIDFSLDLDYVKRDLEYDYGNEVWNIDYSGDEVSFVAKQDGTYNLEVWGAQGGSMPNVNSGGYGAYATGSVKLSKNDLLFINVGGEGESSTTKQGGHVCKGGYNGGGSGGDDNATAWSAGGGATHIATKTGELSTLEDYLSNILIVSAGGGGSGWYWKGNYDINAGGSGGGIKGNNGNGYLPGTGGTQTEGGYAEPDPIHSGAQSNFNLFKDLIIKGSFGKGSDCFYRTDTKTSNGGGGGAGLYGGGSGYTVGSSGGGGSSYIANKLLTNKIMYCYKCTTSDIDSTKTQTTDNVSAEAISKYAKMGNGFARITLISD